METEDIIIENPRSLEGEELDDLDRSYQETVLAEKVRSLSRALDLFAHEAWPDVAATLFHEVERLKVSLISGALVDPHGMGLVRGQIAATLWVLGMPERIRDEVARLDLELKQLREEA